jgi:hypothetical protein
MSRCRWASRRSGWSSRVFGRRVATVVDARSGCGLATPGRCHLSRESARLLREALALREEKERWEPAWFGARLWELEAKLDVQIAEKRRFTDWDNKRFARRLRKRRGHLLRFLRVEPPGGTGPPSGSHCPRQDPAMLASPLQTPRQPGPISVRTAPARLLPCSLPRCGTPHDPRYDPRTLNKYLKS